MQKFVVALLLALPLIPFNAANAKGLDIFLNNNTASAEYLTNVGGADVGFGFLLHIISFF